MGKLTGSIVKKLAVFVCVLALVMGAGILSGCTEEKAPEKGGPGQELIKLTPSGTAKNIKVVESGTYTSKDEVALYIHQFGHVPSNYITKTQARKRGWDQEKGNLWDVLPGMSIGGGGFSNDDGMMPDAPGREWFEVDIDYEGGYRNAKRIVYSNDGLIYYTDDHYETFERLY
ncbi:MAG: ribonuclease domain-containing protein [Eggerthellaceae bacterium]|nr:ribonuclease domain-containing protein [Eggerthellaceae bacterium]